MNTSTSPSGTRSFEANIALLGVMLALFALFCGWYDPASTARLSAWQIGLESGPGTLGSYYLFSFGTVGLIICCVAAGALTYGHRNLLIISTATLLFLGADCFIQIAIVHPEWIEVAKQGAQDFQDTMSFANHYNVPDAYGAAPDDDILLCDGAIADRLAATYSCISYGWCWFMVGSLLALGAAGQYRGKLGHASCPLRLWGAICFLIVAAQLSAPLLGEYYLWHGDKAAAQDQVAEAENCYRKAMTCDGWYRVRPDLYLKIGALRESHGDHKSPEALFSLGEDMILRKSYDLGIYWLNLAAESPDLNLRRQVFNEIARYALLQGRVLYNNGSQDAAIVEWKRSLQARPQQIAVYYMLGKASLDVCNMDEARHWLTLGVRQSSLPVIQSVCLSAIGDTYYRLSDVTQARNYYLASTKAYNQANYRALKSLSDSYFR